MNLFDWLLVAHLVGDFMLQTDQMAQNKGRSWQWMLKHVGLYSIPITAVLVVYGWQQRLPAWSLVGALLFLWVTHVILDRRGLTGKWMALLGSSSNKGWLAIVVDQVLHILTLAIAAQGLVLLGP